MNLRVNPDAIEAVDDPVSALASQGLEVLMDYPDWIGACNRIVFRSMGLHPNTMVGGDYNDKHEALLEWMDKQDYTLLDLVEMSEKDKKDIIPDFLTEDDPRFPMYWELLAQLHSQIFAEMISSQKFRWKPAFADRQTLATKNVMGEANTPS